MIISTKRGTPAAELDKIIREFEAKGLSVTMIRGTDYNVFGLVGDTTVIDEKQVRANPYVENVQRVSEPYKKANRLFHEADSIIDVGGIKVGGSEKIAVIGGPCSIESEEQAVRIAREVKDAGGCMLRGGAYKPRTSPYAFQGLGTEGILAMAAARKATGMPIVSELMSEDKIDEFEEYVDLVQIGARNMQNFQLLKAVGKMKKPVLLKRGLANTIEEWIMSAEYIMAGGNENVIFCERGIRTFEKYTRNTLDLSVVPILKQKSHLPVIIDPSHATGDWRLVESMSLAAIAAGADGLIIEVHNDPPHALCDGAQSITPAQFDALAELKAGCFSRHWDKNLEAGEKWGVEPGRIYPDYHTMLEEEAKRTGEDRLDFVVVATPNNTHYEIVKDIIAHGFHIVCDKPVTFTSRESEELKALAGKLDEINATHLDRRIDLPGTQKELKTLAQAINAMLDRINEAYRSQMRFVSDASHELRTPIAVIQGYANLLNRWGKDDPATRQEAIDAIRQEADSMKELVEQLLFLARGDNDSMHIEMETFDLTEVAAEVLKETGMIDQTHTFSARWEGAVPVCADVGLTKQALRILVDNSIKYTPAGGHITLSAALRDGMARLSVQDEGQGIDAGSLPHVFDRFYRTDQSRARQTGGTGADQQGGQPPEIGSAVEKRVEVEGDEDQHVGHPHPGNDPLDRGGRRIGGRLLLVFIIW